jgi:diguanylate cyclase (GGDEF)-like protein
MRNARSEAWGQNELFEVLALMTMGVCVWIVGAKFGVFQAFADYALKNNLIDVLMFSACMGVGIFAASIRKSFMLRKAIAARFAAEALAESTSRHDALTGLANRRLFRETLERALAARQPDDRLAVMLIDLDRFKPVNDVHGHAAGNAVLCAIADRLRELVPAGSTVARLGGDEFVALLPASEDEATLTDLAERAILAIRTPIAWNHGQVDVDSTIGIAVAAQDSCDAESLLHAADVAMYQGKREGRGTFRFFHAAMDVALQARAQLEADLRRAINRGEIAPYYQPIVALPTRELAGFEVLARWNHPTSGVIAPDDFIPVAEEAGLIGDLFINLLRQACLDARSWPSHLRLAINLSARQLQDHLLPTRILAVLTESGFPPSRLETEITEGALINDLDAARTILTSLQKLGVTIALDDFGTGYSSLYHVSELKFNKLKIDKSYVTTLEQGSERAKLVDAIIQLGASLSLQTTAEGIETDSNLDWLSDQGCNFAQGYLFGRPMPKDAADGFLDAREAVELARQQSAPGRAA